MYNWSEYGQEGVSELNSRFICPYCGGACEVKKNQNLFESSKRWEPSLTQSVAEPRLVEQSHVLVRYFGLNWRHALTSGLLVGLCVTLLYAPMAIEGHKKWYKPLVAGFIAFAVVATVVWAILVFYDRKGLNKLEMATGIDLDGDGHIGEPSPFVVEWSEGKSLKRHYWPIPEERIREVGEAHLERGVALSKRELAKHTSLSEELALVVLKYMRQKAYAQYVDGNTTELTGRGRYFFKSLLAN